MALRFNNDDLDSYLDSQEQERVSNPQLESQEVEEDMGFWGTVGDLAMAPVRGIAGAAEGIYSLADAIAFDILPDAEENFGLGGSETFAGSVVETIVQFGVGFAAPGIGGLSVASKLGKVGKIGKMVDAGNKAVKSQQAAGRYLPALAIARGMEMGKYAVAGAVADFTVFDGHEQRLSNLLQEVPALQNPVTEFLAADEEDPELVGRLKAAIEGAGLGVMVDSVLLGVRAMRAGVKAGPDKKAASIALAERQKELIEEEAKKVSKDVRDAQDVDDLPLSDDLDSLFEVPKNPSTSSDAYPVKRGVEAVQNRINREASQGDLTQEEAIFANSLLQRLSQTGDLENTGIRFRTSRNLGGEDVAGTYDWVNNVISIATQTVKEGRFDRTFVHEVWHALERSIDPTQLAAMRRDLYKQRKAFAKKYGEKYEDLFMGRTGEIKERFSKLVEERSIEKEEFYRLTSAEEWLAENMADATFARLDLEEGTKSLFGGMRKIFRDLLTEIKVKFGKGTYDKIARGFLEGTYSPASKASPQMLDASTLAFKGRSVTADIRPDKTDPLTTKTTEDLTEDLLNPENMGGTVTDATTVLNRMAKDAQALEESQKRVEGSSRPFRQETDAEYQEEVAKRSIQDREEAIAAAKEVDEASGTQLTLLERAIQNLGEVTGEARERAIEFRYRLGAARQLLAEVGRRADAIAKRVLDPTEATSDRDIAEFLLMQGNFKTLANNLRAVQSEWGRNLKSIQRSTTDTPGAAVVKGIPEEEAIAKYSMKNLDDEQTLAYIIDVAGGRDRIIAEMKLFRAAHENSPAGAMKYLRGKAGMMGAVTEWWMNSILSGPTTMIVNGASGVATTLLAPLEKAMGQALSGNFREAGIEFGRVLALPGEMRDAFKAARTAHKTGRGVLEDVGSRADERAAQGGKIEQSIEALTKNIDQENVSIVAAKWLARNVINQPGKILLGTDEFFKQLNYRTVLKAELYKDGLRQGTRVDKLDEYVEKQFNRLVEGNQRVTANKFVKEAEAKFDQTDPYYAAKVQKYVQRQMRKFSPLAERALAAAREATFTTPLSGERGILSGIGKITSDAVIAYPPLRMVLPFVRTPTNIMQFVLDRVPLVGGGQATQIQHMLRRKFSGEVRALTSNQQAEKADALGRLATGSLFFSGAAIAMMNGGLTGGGPKDFKQRRIKEQTGWQPYSFKVGDTYVSYRRLDPFASFLGIAADLVEVMQHGDEQQRTDAMDIALGATMAISKNIASKTYLQGIQDVAGLLFEPEINAPGFLNRTIASFAVPNVFAQTARAGDDEMKDIRSLTDALKARIPGLGAYDEVPPRRNMLGEPIHDNGSSMAVDLLNPFYISTVRDNKMMEEFDKIGHGFSTPRSLKNGVELRDYFNANGQSAYDRWQEMTGQTKIKGRTLKQELTKLMKSVQYKRLPYESMDGVDRSPRARLIQSILTKYRAKAFSEMLREFPEVRERNKIHQMIKTRRTVGRDYQDLLALIED